MIQNRSKLLMVFMIIALVLGINHAAWGAAEADAGSDQHEVGFGATIQLDATGSTGEGDLTYRWEQILGPRVTLSDPTSPTPTFVTPDFLDSIMPSAHERFGVVGLEPNNITLTFRVTVTDASGETDTDDVGIETASGHTTGLRNVGLGELVYFNGATQEAYMWTATGPFGQPVELDEAETRHPHFVPMVMGTYIIREENSGTEISVHVAEYQGIRACAACHTGQLAADRVTPWSQTDHATFFTRAVDGLVSSHYSSSCIGCHTVGYNTSSAAVNGGFDDLMTLSGWEFPSTLESGNWESFVNQFPTLANLSNIQCENCHGPGGDHFGESTTIDVSFADSSCGVCHNEGTHHIKNEQFRFGPHSRLVSGTNQEGCTKCHTVQGFIQETIKGGSPVVPNAPEPQTCVACHDPHSRDNPHHLRAYGSATLPNGFVIEEAGAGAICINCHNSRRDASDPAAIFNRAPHGSPQGDMLAGSNAMEIPGETYTNSFHSGPEFIGFFFSDEGSRENDTCVTCHMASAEQFADQTGTYNRLGEHSFKIATFVDGQRIENLDACNLCHSLTTFNRRARGDFDGNGAVEGIQTEVSGLLAILRSAIEQSLGGGHFDESHGRIHFFDPASTEEEPIEVQPTDAQYIAAYNYFFVLNDGSFGIHNTAYAVQVLQSSYRLLTGTPVPNAEPHRRVAADFKFRSQ
ncbi:MAG: hypothetical protein JRG73_04895 [Deltaproteobacteria bacterium]|nr:hypothetical protein [Deltaproteobacteria bacterium]